MGPREAVFQASWGEEGPYPDVAGMAGLEPANAGVKVPCLTTWLHPNMGCEPRAGADAPALSHKYGVGNGARTHDTRNHNPVLCQLSYTHRMEFLARLKGLEPLTHCLEGSCSIHLSYRRISCAQWGPRKAALWLCGGRRSGGMSGLSPQAEAKGMKPATTWSG